MFQTDARGVHHLTLAGRYNRTEIFCCRFRNAISTWAPVSLRL